MKKVVFIVFMTSLLAISWTHVKHGFGSIGGYSNSPGDGENCTVCHPQNIRPAGYWVYPVNMPSNGFIPGDTLKIFLMATQDGMKNAGFEIRAEDVHKNKVGAFLITDSVQTRKTVFGSVTHTANGHETNSGLKTWMVDLAVPQNAPDTFTLYTSFNLNNGSYGINDTTRTSALTLYKSPIAKLNTIDENDLRMFPMPFANGFHIKGLTPGSTISVFDLNGHTLFECRDESYIAMDGFPKGMYLLKIEDGNRKGQIRKIIKGF